MSLNCEECAGRLKRTLKRIHLKDGLFGVGEGELEPQSRYGSVASIANQRKTHHLF